MSFKFDLDIILMTSRVTSLKEFYHILYICSCQGNRQCGQRPESDRRVFLWEQQAWIRKREEDASVCQHPLLCGHRGEIHYNMVGEGRSRIRYCLFLCLFFFFLIFVVDIVDVPFDKPKQGVEFGSTFVSDQFSL